MAMHLANEVNAYRLREDPHAVESLIAEVEALYGFTIVLSERANEVVFA